MSKLGNLAKTVIKAKTKVIKWKIMLWVAVALLLITLPIVLLTSIILLVGDNENKDLSGYTVNGQCTVSGGTVSAKGVDFFEENAKGGALEGKGDYIIKSAKKHKIDPKIFISIISHETGYGKSELVKTHNNPAGLMGDGDPFKFDTIEEGIDAAAKNLYDLYFSEGLNTVDKIQKKYAPIGVANDPNDLNSNWAPTIKKIMKSYDGKDSKKECSSNSGGKDIKFNGKLPGWSNSSPGKNNLYTAGQCTWYAYGIRQKMGKPVSTFWGDAHNWNDRAKQEGYKVNKTAKPGALFIAERGAGGHDNYYGHVAIVIGVSDNGNKFKISEMNWEGEYKVNERTVTMTDGYSFIHDKE